MGDLDARLRDVVARLEAESAGSRKYARVLEELGGILLEFRSSMFAVARSILHHQHDAEEVADDRIAKLCTEPLRLVGKMVPTAYILESVRLRAIDVLRKRKRRRTISIDDAGESHDPMTEAYLENRQVHRARSEDHWRCTADGRLIEREETCLVLQFAICEMIRGTCAPIPSGKRLREQLATEVETSMLATLDLFARKRVPAGIQKRYYDMMLVWCRDVEGLSTEEAAARLEWLERGRKSRPGAEPRREMSKTVTNRLNARVRRARERLAEYLADNGYRWGGEF